MCPPNPFPLTPICSHTHDQLDREIVLFLIKNEKERFSLRDLQREVLPPLHYDEDGYNGSSGLELVRRRINLLEKEGFTDKLKGWLWTVTTKGKEAHCLWLWSNITNLTNLT